MAFGKQNNYLHSEMGFNFRMPMSQAEMVLKSLHNYEKANKKRRQVEKWYNDFFKDKVVRGHRDAVWVYDLITPNRDKIVKKLYSLGVRPFFKPMSQQPMYFNEHYKDLNAYTYSLMGLYLPVNETITKKTVKHICDVVLKYS